VKSREVRRRWRRREDKERTYNGLYCETCVRMPCSETR
jgi:hypothetical protein